ncbi:unnamed protein product [Choristocarpus tenellus]
MVRHTRSKPVMSKCKRLIYLVLVLALLPSPYLAFLTMPRISRLSFITSTRWTTSTSPFMSAEVNADGTAPERHPKAWDRSLPMKFIQNLTVSIEGEFVSSDDGGEPTEEELSNVNMLRIIAEVASNEMVNNLAWRCLGYRCDPATGVWTNSEVFPKWKIRFPNPPDFMGVTGDHSRAVDLPVKQAVQALTRSIPDEHKQSLPKHLGPLGFTGFYLQELTPNRTRRGQVANFILHYRENLWRVPLEELQRRAREKHLKQKREEADGEHIAHRPLFEGAVAVSSSTGEVTTARDGGEEGGETAGS